MPLKKGSSKATISSNIRRKAWNKGVHARFCRSGHDTELTGRATNGNCRLCANLATARWRERNWQHVKLVAQRRNLLKRLEFPTFTAAVEAQSGKCRICDEIPPLRHGERRLHIDHDHATGAFRGLLCQRCNIGLGQFQDSPALLAKAIVYLEEHNAAQERQIPRSG